ncbi:MAG: 2-dehydropantoate 2-reductase [Deltaproteobacteria bacterium]|nr:2-dehydropantoate 2-reductase [Deltaproteobacteria bacterium]
MKIGVVGPGAMGGLLAVKLARAGLEVRVLDHRPERAALIGRQGIELLTGEEEVREMVPVTLDPAALGDVELILICVKAYDTEGVARQLQALPSGPYFLTLQNGVGNVELLGKYLPPEKILAGITSHGATSLGPGRIRHAGVGDTYIGLGFGESSEEAHPGLRLARTCLAAAGFATRIVPRICSLIWSKLMVNVGINALTALTGLRNGGLLDFPATERIMAAAVREAVQVAEARGIPLLFDNPLEEVRKVCRQTGPNISSMLQDVLRQKKTEIDYINGAIVREGEKLGRLVPVNSLLTGLVQTIENSYEQRVRTF